MSDSQAVYAPLALPDFGIAIDLETGEMRRQIGAYRYEKAPLEDVSHAFALRGAARRLLGSVRITKDASGSTFPAYRVVRCGVNVLDQALGVGVFRFADSCSSHYGGLVQCGSVWHCAVCARKVATRRRAELSVATSRHVAAGGSVALLTCTIPHAADQSCTLVLDRLQLLFDRLNSGRSAKPFRTAFGVVGQVRVLEFTRGANGWHPHIHALLFAEGKPDWTAAADALWGRWASAARRVFGWDLPRLSLDLRGGEAASNYVTKWGVEAEITGQAFKQGRGSLTPFGLLGAYLDGDSLAGQRFQEYAGAVSRVTGGRVSSTRQLVWSRGLKSRFALEDVSDEVLAEQPEAPSRLLGHLSYEQWLTVLRQPFDARLTVLHIASVGSFDDVLAFVNNLPQPLEANHG